MYGLTYKEQIRKMNQKRAESDAKFASYMDLRSKQPKRLPPALAALAKTPKGTAVMGKKQAEDQGIDVAGSIDQFSVDRQVAIQEALVSGNFANLNPLEVAWINAQVAKTQAQLEAEAAMGSQTAEEILGQKAEAVEEAQLTEIRDQADAMKKGKQIKMAKKVGAGLALVGLAYLVIKATR